MTPIKLFLNIHNWRNGVTKVKASTQKNSSPLRFGVLGAAEINYTAIIDPIQSHRDAILTGIAARSKAKAEAQMTKYGLGSECKAYGSYDELLDDPDIDAVYIPLPNSLHMEWAITAMERGKHVLIEKPIASNAAEARRIKEASERTGKVALEAFHWRFHPVSIRVKKIIDSGKYGSMIGADVSFSIPRGAIGVDDIRFKYDLAGGATMDLTYVISACKFFTGDTGNVRVRNATARINAKDSKIDDEMTADFVIEREGQPPVQCHTKADSANPPLFGIIPKVWEMMPFATLELEKARIVFPSFVLPTLGNGFVIHHKDEAGKLTGSKTAETDIIGEFDQHYNDGQRWWTTYRWQLEAFVGKVRAVQKGKTWDGPWMDLDQSVRQMEAIDAVYDKAGLPRRGA